MNEHDAIRKAINGAVGYILKNQGKIPIEIQKQLTELLRKAHEKLIALKQQPVEPPIPLGADLLWQIAGGQPEAFISYLRTVPDPHLNAVARNDQLLRQTIAQLQRQFPQPEPQVAAGIEKAPLESSNIWGFHYNPRSGHLLVRFQGGNVYAYDGVPPGVFQIFQQGAVPAKTQGQNAYGKWWVGKIPSLGAAFYEMIRNGGYPYERVA